MTVELISPETERKAVDVVKSAIDHYNGDATLTPSQALIKAAEGQDFTPDMLCRLVEAFNSSAQLAHLESSDTEKRADAIPLAVASEVVEAFFPEKVQTPVEKAAAVEAPDCYEGPERSDFMPVTEMEKAASETPIRLSRKPREYNLDPNMIYARIQRDKQALYKQSELEQTEAQRHLDKVAQCAQQLGGYFRRLDHTAFEEVEKRASVNFVGIDDLMGYVFTSGNLAKLGEKRAEVTGEGILFIDDSELPYSLIKDAVASSEAYAEHLIKAAELLDSADSKYEQDMRDYGLYKEAVGSLGSMLGGGTDKMWAPKEPLTPTKTPVISDPEHEAQLASIKQQAALNDMLTNDPVIAAVDPQEVIQAFNRLSSVAPHVARDPNLLRSVLRRYVQQEDIDPFEAKQLVDLDTALGKRDEPTEAERLVLS